MGSFKKPLPPLAEKTYKLLIKENGLTAQEMGVRLGIFPNAVYRCACYLTEFGLVSIDHERPVRFYAKHPSEAVDTFLDYQKNLFFKKFIIGETSGKSLTSRELDVSFVKSRSELVEKVTVDQNQAKTDVNFVISGDEIPPETILANKKAVDRGVVLRLLVQRVDAGNRGMLKSWQKMGLKVRYLPEIKSRLMVVDSKIVYITSLNTEVNEEAIGVRFVYKPFAQIMNGYFMQRWRIADRI